MYNLVPGTIRAFCMQGELAALEAQRADAEAALAAARARRGGPRLLRRLAERRFVLSRAAGGFHGLPAPEVHAYGALRMP